MKADILVYVSGPMQAKDGRTIEQNCADGVGVYLDLLARGIPAFSPHLCGLAPSAWTALTHAQWIAYDCAILDRCTHILMMPRWETSTGACLERDYWIARQRGEPCYSLRELDERIALCAAKPAAGSWT